MTNVVKPISTQPNTVQPLSTAIQNPVSNNTVNTNQDLSMTLDVIKKLKPAFYSTYIINLQNKEFITYNGLMVLAKEKGINRIETEVVQVPTAQNNNTCIIHARVYGLEKNKLGQLVEVVYDGIGDANAGNCNKNVARHSIRMAETRAKARALRDFVGIDVCSSEELGGDSSPYTEVKVADTPMTQEQVHQITQLKQQLGWDSETTKNFSISTCGTGDLSSYTHGMADALIRAMNTTLQNLTN